MRLRFGAPQPTLGPARLLLQHVLVQERLLQLIGIDPLASASWAGHAGGARAALIEGTADARPCVTQPGSVLMSARTAADLRLADGAR